MMTSSDQTSADSRLLRASAWAYLGGFVLHTGDHLRRGLGSVTPEVLWAGNAIRRARHRCDHPRARPPSSRPVGRRSHGPLGGPRCRCGAPHPPVGVLERLSASGARRCAHLGRGAHRGRGGARLRHGRSPWRSSTAPPRPQPTAASVCQLEVAPPRWSVLAPPRGWRWRRPRPERTRSVTGDRWAGPVVVTVVLVRGLLVDRTTG